MSGQFRLPRGQHDGPSRAPIATARWARCEEIRPHGFHDGTIWLGALQQPHKDAEPWLQKLETLASELEHHSSLLPAYRSQRIAEAKALKDRLLTETAPIGFSGDQHGAIFSGTRGGKGVTTVVPICSTYTGSLAVLDPKRENAKLTAARRGAGDAFCEGMGQRVRILDVDAGDDFEADQLASWNALDLVDPDDENAILKARAIADALILREAPEHGHFDDAASDLITALIIYVKLIRGALGSLVDVRALLTQGVRAEPDGDTVERDTELTATVQLLFRLELIQDTWGIVAGTATTLLDMGDRERGSVLSTARRATRFLDIPGVRRVVSQSTFSIDELKTAPEGSTVFLCVPAQLMRTCAGWIRLMFAAMLERMYELPSPAAGSPTLLLMDEMATIRRLEALETAVGYGAGFGIKLVCIFQDLSQLKRDYPKSWETFLGNAGCVQLWANNDATTLEYFSKRMGQIEAIQVNTSTSTTQSANTSDGSAHDMITDAMVNRGQMSMLNPLAIFADRKKASFGTNSSVNQSESRQAVPLIRPDELERAFSREAGNQVVLMKGSPPMALTRIRYFDSLEFVGRFTPLAGTPERDEPVGERQQRLLEERGQLRAKAIKRAAEFIGQVRQELVATAKPPAR